MESFWCGAGNRNLLDLRGGSTVRTQRIQHLLWLLKFDPPNVRPRDTALAQVPTDEEQGCERDRGSEASTACGALDWVGGMTSAFANLDQEL